MKRFRTVSYFALSLVVAAAGLACSSAPNETSNANGPAANSTATSGASTTGSAAPGQSPAAAAPGASPSPASTPGAASTTTEVKVYLVAVGDNGKKGKKIGCEDSLIPVTRTIKPTTEPLRAALEELLAVPREFSKELGNYWQGRNLKVKSVAVADGVATINITGEGPSVAGICDEPRITEQIEETARQFPTVKKVRVFVNDRTLAEAIR